MISISHWGMFEDAPIEAYRRMERLYDANNIVLAPARRAELLSRLRIFSV